MQAATNKKMQSPNEKYFKGFERSPRFEHLWNRLQQLERWKELAIRPSRDECDPDDIHLLENELDDLSELQKRCDATRVEMNNNLPPIELVLDDELIPKKSGVPQAGLGLFYEPTTSTDESDGKDSHVLPQGTTVCYYTGHIHDFKSSKRLEDKSYLMMIVGDTLVDPGPVKSIKARYINDPLNEDLVNCKYVPEEVRSAVVTTRDIHPGEELFASYGDAYWSSHKTPGRILLQQKQ